MSLPDKLSLLKKILKALGLSEERIEELIGWIQTWLSDDAEKKGKRQPQYPYRLRDDFLSPAEQNFHRVLQTVAADWALIAPKVSLGDLFYAQTGDYTQNRIYRNKIDRKHVDFLLYNPQSLQPILGIELGRQKPPASRPPAARLLCGSSLRRCRSAASSLPGPAQLPDSSVTGALERESRRYFAIVSC